MATIRPRTFGTLLSIATLIGACTAGSATPPASAPGGTPAAVATGATPAPTQRRRSDPTSEPTAEPAPSGLLLLPSQFAEPLEPGTYWSAPPFDLGFAFTLAAPGWVMGHRNPEFVDLQRYDGEPAEGVTPERIIGFAHPLEIHGSSVVDVGELTPADVAQLWVDRSDIEATNVSEIDLLGGEAVRVDVHAPVPMLPLFGGDDGTFRLDGQYDVRLVIRAVEGGLFLASVHADADDLEAAWGDALPVLESIDLGAR